MSANREVDVNELSKKLPDKVVIFVYDESDDKSGLVYQFHVSGNRRVTREGEESMTFSQEAKFWVQGPKGKFVFKANAEPQLLADLTAFMIEPVDRQTAFRIRVASKKREATWERVSLPWPQRRNLRYC